MVDYGMLETTRQWLFGIYPVTMLAAAMLAPWLSRIKRRSLISGLGIALLTYGVSFLLTLLWVPITNRSSPVSEWILLLVYLVEICALTGLLYMLAKREYACSEYRAGLYVITWWSIAVVMLFLIAVVTPS